MALPLARPLISSVLDPNNKSNITDEASGSTWEVYEGDPLGLRFLIARRAKPLTDDLIFDVSGLQTLEVEIRAATAPEPDVDLTYGTATVFTACTAEEWAAGTGQHCLIELDAAHAGSLPGGTNYHVGIFVTPAVGEPFSIAVGQLKVIKDRAGDGAGVVLAGGGAGISAVAADIRFPRWFKDITGYTGGGATNLDGLAMAALALGTLAQFAHATAGLRSFILKAGTTATDSTDFTTVRGTDYAAGTNERFWQSV